MTDSVANDDDDDMPAASGGAVMPAPAGGKQRALLILVITLGVLILLAFGVLVGGLIMGLGGRAGGNAPWSYSLDVPRDTRVMDAHMEGGRVLLHLDGPAGEDVVLIDADSGKIVGRIQIKPPR